MKHEEGDELRSREAARRQCAVKSSLGLAAWIVVVFVLGDLISDRPRLASGSRWLEIAIMATLVSVVSYVAKIHGDIVLWRGRPEPRGFDVLPKEAKKRAAE